MIEQLLQKIRFHANEGIELVTIAHLPDELELVGIGTDAVVVKHSKWPSYVWKVFAAERVDKKEAEYQVYQQLTGAPFFATCHGQGDNYLCLSYEYGPTLYECLEQGIVIPEQIVADVAEACNYAQKQGLNPRDIHLKNVLLQDGRAKLIDVSEYVKPGNDNRWGYLVTGYKHFYPLIQGRKIPTWLIELVKNAYYNHQQHEQFSVIEFCQRFIQLLGINKKS